MPLKECKIIYLEILDQLLLDWLEIITYKLYYEGKLLVILFVYQVEKEVG